MLASDWLNDDSELAETSSSDGRMSRTIAVAAGLKKAPAAPKMTDSRNNSHR